MLIGTLEFRGQEKYDDLDRAKCNSPAMLEIFVSLFCAVAEALTSRPCCPARVATYMSVHERAQTTKTFVPSTCAAVRRLICTVHRA